MMTEQASLLDLFEQRSVEPLEQMVPAAPRERVNPFAKKFGDCCGRENVRVYWCHGCNKTPGCWDCFIKHKCS